MPDITYYWDKFITYITSYDVTLETLGFNQGTTLKKINTIEKQLGVQLPEDYKRLLQLCNGQDPTRDSIFNWLPTENRLLSIEKVLEEWGHDHKYYGEMFSDQYYDDDRIRGYITHKKRIPIAIQPITSSNIFLDYIPGPDGSEGQLLGVEGSQMLVLANNFTILLKKYVALIDKGIMKFRKDDKNRSISYELYFPRGKTFFSLSAVTDRFRGYFKD